MEVEFNGKNLDDFFIKTAKGDEDMTENNAKMHVLADETLGGIKREYVEVDRKAEVGEKIITVESCKEFEVGEVFTVTECNRWYDGTGISVYETGIGLYHHEYRALKPTDIVHIDGQRYEMADRKAKVGEKVIITRKLDCCMLDTKIGSSYEVVRLVEGTNGDVNVIDDTDEEATALFGGYSVLVPVEAESDEPLPSDLIDVVSNLAARVADLERVNKKLRAALDEDMKIRSENTRRYLALKDEIDTLHKDNRTLGEELARLKEPAKIDDILDAPFVLVLHEGRGKFDVYRHGKKLKEIAEVEIEVQADMNTKVRIGHFPGDWLV
ncbi:hypothetical protein C7H81_01915 [Bacillus subtilis]|nr:hypothetical protein CVV77_06780 [Bacillus sp. SN1]PSI05761.1 hypothetical protein C7H81_01915 [Bacillus subtilis]